MDGLHRNKDEKFHSNVEDRVSQIIWYRMSTVYLDHERASKNKQKKKQKNNILLVNLRTKIFR